MFQFDGAGNILSRNSHSPLKPDDILATNITITGVQAGLAKSSGDFYYLKDAIGTVTDIISGSRQTIQSYDYSAFGKIVGIRGDSGNSIAASPAVNTAFTFTGREWDSESDLYYYRARYYDPSIGRFLQEDSYPGQTQFPVSVNNRYAYTGNGPTIFTDPTGRWSIIPIVIGAIAGAIDAAINHKAILSGAILGAIAGLAMGFTWNMASPTTLFGLIQGGSAAHAVGFGLKLPRFRGVFWAEGFSRQPC